MECKCKELIDYIEKEIMLVEELLEQVACGKRIHLELDATKSSYERILNFLRC